MRARTLDSERGEKDTVRPRDENLFVTSSLVPARYISTGTGTVLYPGTVPTVLYSCTRARYSLIYLKLTYYTSSQGLASLFPVRSKAYR